MGRLGKRKGIYDCGPMHARQSVEGGTAVGICRLGREGDPSRSGGTRDCTWART